jgi:hypothetical protein
MSKLCIVSRDGKSINDFLDLHNLDKSDIKIIKTAKDLTGCEGMRYVIINPIPLNYHWKLRPLILQLKMINVTKFYNKLLNR